LGNPNDHSKGYTKGNSKGYYGNSKSNSEGNFCYAKGNHSKGNILY
jgi:hypothetical protein